MTGGEIPVGTGIAVTKFVVERSKPGFALAWSILRGRTVIVAGPSEAGKTTFLRYARYKVLSPPQYIHRTIDPETTKHFKLRLGEEGALEVGLKQAVDLPGQYRVADAAKEAWDNKAEGRIVMLDASAPPEGEGSTTDWLVAFCEAMNAKFGAAKPKKNKLRSVIVVLNKMDVVDENAARVAEATIETLMSRHWRAGGPDTKPPLVRGCVAVENPRKGEPMNQILTDLAFGLKGSL